MAAHTTPLRRARQKGQELIEFTLMVFVILGFIYMIIDISWLIFTRATLQYAVREGCRWAVANGYYTTTPVTTTTTEAASITGVVQANSMGFLGTGNANLITVKWYAPSALSTPLGNADANKSPNVVEVAVTNFPQTPLLGIFTENSVTKFNFNAASADVME